MNPSSFCTWQAFVPLQNGFRWLCFLCPVLVVPFPVFSHCRTQGCLLLPSGGVGGVGDSSFHHPFLACGFCWAAGQETAKLVETVQTDSQWDTEDFLGSRACRCVNTWICDTVFSAVFAVCCFLGKCYSGNSVSR